MTAGSCAPAERALALRPPSSWRPAVIASDTGANSELIEDGVSGLIYRYQDAVDLSAKIETLYRDRDKLNSYGRSARRTVEEKFTIEANCRGILDVYRGQTPHGGV